MAANSPHDEKSSRPWAAPTDAPGQKALRVGRASLANHVYHVTTPTHERLPAFLELAPGRILAASLNDRELLGDARTLAWVAMPDHLHWLVQLGGELSLDTLMLRFKSSTSRRINRLQGRQGSLWQRGYYDHLVRDDENLHEVAHYIVANPLRAGLVKRLGDYPLWDAVWLE